MVLSPTHKAVEVENLVKIYPGGIKGIDGVTFSVEEGEIYGLIGPNGSGKTTTLRIIATILKPTSGYARVFGHDVVKEPLAVRRYLSYFPEEAGAYRDLRGIDFIKFMVYTRLEGREAEEAVEEAIRISELGESLKQPVRRYSKGMKRILALSVVLASKPRLAILDEPTSGLDVERSIEVRNLIKRYVKNYGVTVLLSSHNMLEVETLCEKVAIIHRGRIVAEGYVDELKSRYSAVNLEEVFLEAIKSPIKVEA